MKTVRRIIFILALIVFIGSAGYLLRYFLQNYQAEKNFDGLKSEQGYDLAALHAANGDCVGWIRIPDTRVDYPVMWTPKDPEYYLRRDFNGEYQQAGTPFLDGASDPGSANFILYGHNMKAGTMFSDLTKYEDRDFYEAHRTLYYETIWDGLWEYEVLAVYPTAVGEGGEGAFRYYDYPVIFDQYTYDTYVKGVKAKSVQDTGVKAAYPEKLLTLSTCEYSRQDGRFVLVARPVKKLDKQPAVE